MISINIDKLKSCNSKRNFILKNLKDKNLDIELIYCSNFENTKILRDFVEIIGHEIGLVDKYLSRFVLVIDELNNNAIEYGSDECGKNKFRVKLVNKGKNIFFNIEVEDNGKGKNPKTSLEMEVLRAHQLKLGYGIHDSIRGRGLFMITVRSVDRLYFKDAKGGGLIVGLNKVIEI